MKANFKIFIISFICFSLLLGGGALAFLMSMDDGNPTYNFQESKEDNENWIIPNKPLPDKVEKPKTELEILIEESKRINVLLLGLEGARTDTIILASFDPKSKEVDLISIPRDTYYIKEGYNGNNKSKKKINAVYGFKKADGGGAYGSMKAVSDVLQIPVYHYITLSNKGVEEIVDSLGGVKVNIPFDMDYDDPYASPPLHIHFKKGPKVLSGKEAIKFLRHRQNNDKSHSADGDLGRIKRQQQFLKAAAKKALSFRIKAVVNTALKFVKTSMELDDMMYYATKAVGISMDDIKTHQLPGKPKAISNTSYYIHDSEAIEKLMIDIYKQD